MRKLREVLALLALVGAWAMVGAAYEELPQRIPSPFLGMSDRHGMGDKDQLWLLVTLGVVVYLGTWFVNMTPPTTRLSRPMTPEEMEMTYDKGAEMASWLRLETMLFFLVVTVQDVRRAEGHWMTLWPWGLALWLTAVVLTVRQLSAETQKILDAREPK